MLRNLHWAVAHFACVALLSVAPAFADQSESCEETATQDPIQIATLSEVQKLPEWQTAFMNHAKDWRYYEIINQTINVDQLDYRYLVVRNEKGRVLAIQPGFLIKQDILEGSSEKVKKLADKVRSVWPGFLKMKTLMIGNSAGPGYLQPTDEKDRAETVRILSRHLVSAAKELGVYLVVFKEFPRSEFNSMSPLVKDGPFAVIPSLPKTVQDLSGFKTFDEFLKAQSQNGRAQIKKNLKASTGPNISPVTFEVHSTAHESIDQIHALYKQVFDKATQKFEILTPEYFRLLSERMSDKMRFFLWKQDGRIIGMGLNMIEGDTLLTEYVGLDYATTHDLKLFFRMHYDTVTWAINNGFKRLLNTPTAYEYKRRFGQTLTPVDLYLAQTFSSVFNGLLKKFAVKMDPTVNEPELPKFPNFDVLAIPQLDEETGK